ncbi:MAG: hypothetical protein JXR63_01415 [Spirochaetales bacterium]|nr:hypothetical protein [Spirochaetales bacterium]
MIQKCISLCFVLVLLVANYFFYKATGDYNFYMSIKYLSLSLSALFILVVVCFLIWENYYFSLLADLISVSILTLFIFWMYILMMHAINDSKFYLIIVNLLLTFPFLFYHEYKKIMTKVVQKVDDLGFVYYDDLLPRNFYENPFHPKIIAINIFLSFFIFYKFIYIYESFKDKMLANLLIVFVNFCIPFLLSSVLYFLELIIILRMKSVKFHKVANRREGS